MTSTASPAMLKIVLFASTTRSASASRSCAFCSAAWPSDGSTYTLTPLVLVPTSCAVPVWVGHAGPAPTRAVGAGAGVAVGGTSGCRKDGVDPADFAIDGLLSG